MVLEVKHTFQSAKGDGPDVTLVQPTDWNALHSMAQGPGLIGNPTAAIGPTIEIPLGLGLTFEDGALVNSVKGVPIGAVVPFAGDFAPPYWLFCYGQAVSREIFATLFSVIKTLYGIGDGVTTFNVPDLRGRIAAGRDNMGGTNANRIKDTVDGKLLGAAIGTERHILTEPQLPPHRHFVLTEDSTSDGMPTIDETQAIAWQNTPVLDIAYKLEGRGVEPTWGRTSVTGGLDEPHLNMQPSIILNYIIWAGATV